MMKIYLMLGTAAATLRGVGVSDTYDFTFGGQSFTFGGAAFTYGAP